MGKIQIELSVEEQDEFCRRFAHASYSDRIVMLAMTLAKQADGTWLELKLGRPKITYYEATREGENDHLTAAVEGGVSSENASVIPPRHAI